MQIRPIVYGMVFGFILSRVGATDYDAITQMLLFKEWHLFGVIGLAVGLGALGMTLLKRFSGRARSGEPLALAKKPFSPGLVAGALMFGVGWGLSGACPGTALAQIGEGHLMGLAVVAGIFGGALLQRRFPLRAVPTR